MPFVPVVPTFSPGILSPTDLGLLALAARFAQEPPRFKLRQAASQNILNNISTPVTFDAHVLDIDIDGVAGHSDTVNNSRWVCRYPGQYEICGTVSYVSEAAGVRRAWLRVNGVDQDATSGSIPGSTSDAMAVHTHPGKVILAIGDYVELLTAQNSGLTVATYVVAAVFASALDGLWVSR